MILPAFAEIVLRGFGLSNQRVHDFFLRSACGIPANMPKSHCLFLRAPTWPFGPSASFGESTHAASETFKRVVHCRRMDFGPLGAQTAAVTAAAFGSSCTERG